MRGGGSGPAGLRGATVFLAAAVASASCCPSSPGFSNCKGRSLIGHNTLNGTCVDEFSSKVLTSGLTTVFLPIVYTIVFIIGIPSNGLALWVFLFRTPKKHPSVIYMANLALADLLSVIWFPLKISYHINGNNWIYGEGLCRVMIAFFYGNMYCSILFMTCLSVQRYWAVVNPIAYFWRKSNVALGISSVIWLLIMLSTIPLYVMNQTVHIPALNLTTCHDVLPEAVLAGDMFNYFLSLAIGAFLFPVSLTTSVYVLMIKVLNSSQIDENSGKKLKRAVKLIIIVMTTHLICFTPSNILLVVHYSLIRTRGQSFIYAGYIVALCLSTLNSCIDPFIYYFVSQDFRDHVKNTLRGRSVRTVKRIQVSLMSKRYPRKCSTYTSSYSSSSTNIKSSS